MNKELLLQIFKAPYNRQSFIDNVLLPTVQGKVDDLEIYDQYGTQEVDLTASEEQYAKSAVKYGEFTTRDDIGRTVELYEVILHDHKQVERSRVGIAALIKKQIIGNNAVLVNFAYQNPQNRSWRFSFIAHDAIFSDGEMVQSETNPKRYTYVFGEPDETYRTALERFYTLGHEYSITVESIKDAFGVEAMSKAFFDEYRDIHYNGFVDYLTRSNFKQSAFNGDEKAIRDFVKKLLGRIVFLYFIQKKGWLGASNGNYQDGDKNFMSNFYKKAGANEVFYSTWLSKLFFDTLNNPRPNDAFKMPDGTSVMIPYLNGGLFEKESNKYDFLTFPTDLFSDLFEFFDQYNFTIYEDSPEEHTVAVDPEMLGHIFENLLEDNKDKGAFYTPKEIVHYMTQESLIEYLHTQIPNANRNDLEAFVKNKDNNLSEQHKKQIDQKLDAVKICDPAIGSGAFPMGLLQEIFGMKERIAYELGYNVWSPATVKEHIIQNSIYGVDIEQGAVDIARLRFWLSLIVDEDMPKALPNLDYKIVVGNSLVSKFEDEIIEIDWSTDDTSVGLFGQEIIAEKTKLLQTISDKQKDFFTADNDSKPKLSAQIRKLKLDILAKQLELMIETKGAKRDSNSLGKPSKKQLAKYLETEGWKRTLAKINQLKSNDKPFMHFDWKLDFPEVLNPLATDHTGFDIVIGNPPYIDSETMVNNGDSELREVLSKQLNFTRGNWDIYIAFFEIAYNLLAQRGNMVYITPDKWISKPFGVELRKGLLDNYRLITEAGRKVFKTAKVDSIITFISKKQIPSLSVSTIERDEVVFLTDYNKKKLIEPFAFDWLFSNNIKLLERIEESELRFKDYLECENACATSDAYKLKEYLIDLKDSPFNERSHLKVINTGTIDKYSNRWGKKEMTYLKDKYIKPVVNRSEFLEAFENTYGAKSIKPKLIIKGLTLLDASMDEDGKIIPGKSTLVITSLEKELLASSCLLLNSKLPIFYIKEKYRGSSYNQGVNFSKDMINELPTPNLSKIEKTSLQIIPFIIPLKSEIPLFEKVSNNLVLDLIYEVVDAIIFELYFSEDFQSKGIEIERYAKELFVPIEDLSDQDKLEQIKSVYEELREKKNPLRNQIKLMKIELKDLLNPILSL